MLTRVLIVLIFSVSHALAGTLRDMNDPAIFIEHASALAKNWPGFDVEVRNSGTDDAKAERVPASANGSFLGIPTSASASAMTTGGGFPALTLTAETQNLASAGVSRLIEYQVKVAIVRCSSDDAFDRQIQG
jgi:hypothetical protein